MQNMQGHVPESTCIPYKTPEHTSQTQVTMYNVYCMNNIHMPLNFLDLTLSLPHFFLDPIFFLI